MVSVHKSMFSVHKSMFSVHKIFRHCFRYCLQYCFNKCLNCWDNCLISRHCLICSLFAQLFFSDGTSNGFVKCFWLPTECVAQVFCFFSSVSSNGWAWEFLQWWGEWCGWRRRGGSPQRSCQTSLCCFLSHWLGYLPWSPQATNLSVVQLDL